MAGTSTGGHRAANTNKQRYGEHFYREIGRRGGKISRGGGFASMKVGPDGVTGRARAVEAGRKGGIISKRGSYDAGPVIEQIHASPEYLKSVSPVSRIRNLFNR